MCKFAFDLGLRGHLNNAQFNGTKKNNLGDTTKAMKSGFIAWLI